MRIQPTVTSILVLVLLSLTTNAQTANSSPDVSRQFYFFVTRGVVSGIEVEVTPHIPVPDYRAWQVGGAVEWFKAKGLAIGAELAGSPIVNRSTPITYTYRTSAGAEATNTVTTSGVRGWLSLNLAYHFKVPLTKGKLVPFLTAGGTILARDGLGEAGNYGGGVSLWTTSHLGMRLEYRQYILREPFPKPRYQSVRLGFVLR